MNTNNPFYKFLESVFGDISSREYQIASMAFVYRFYTNEEIADKACEWMLSHKNTISKEGDAVIEGLFKDYMRKYL